MPVRRRVRKNKKIIRFETKNSRKFSSARDVIGVLYDAVPDGILTADIKTGKIVNVNSGACRLFGYSSKEFLTKHISRLHPASEIQGALARFSELVRGKIALASNIPCIQKSGTVFFADIAARPVLVDKRSYLVGLFRDVTFRKQTEERLRKTLSLARATLESTADGILVVNNQSRRVVDFNEKFRTMWRLSKSLLEKREDKKILKAVFHQLKYPEKFFLKVEWLYKHPQKDSFDTIEFKDGRVLERYSHPQKIGRHVIGRVWSFRDVTGSKKMEHDLEASEARFRRLFEAAKDGILILNKKTGQVDEVNPFLVNLLGYSRQALLGKKLWEIGAFKNILGSKRAFRKFQKNKYIRFNNVPLRTKSGGFIFSEFTSNVYRIDGAEVVQCNIRDVTDRKRSEDALNLEREFSKALLENMNSGVVACDENGKLVLFNRIARKWHGLDAARVGSREWAKRYDLYAEDGVTLLSEKTVPLARAYHGEVVQNVGMVIARKGAPKRHILTNASPILNDAGKRIGAVAIMNDITARKQAEVALTNSEERLRFAMEGMGAGEWDLDLVDHVTQRSLQHDRIFGYKTLLPQWSYEIFLKHVIPEDRELVNRKFLQALKTKGEWNFECRILRGDQKERWIWACGRPYNDEIGKPRRLVGIVQDITERKQIEEALSENRRQLREIIDAVPHMIFAKDREGQFLLVNRAVGMMYGTEPQQLIGRKLKEIHPVLEEAEKFVVTDRQVLDTRKSLLVPHEPFTDMAGRTHVLQTIKIPFKMAGISDDAILGVSVDITEQKKVEEFRNDIVRMVSHELRTPLSIEKEGVNLVLDGTLGPLAPKQKMILQAVMRSINRLSRMISGLLDISRIESGKMELHKEKTILNDLLKDAVFEFRKKFEEKGLTIKLNLPKHEVEIWVDPDKITQVATNLIENALKFTEKGGVEIFLEILKDEVECRVRDTGIGIAPENIEKIFEKFQQLSRVAGPGEKGLGLGLSIVREIIGLHGGRIWAQSEKGKGTQVTFTLPFSQEAGIF